MHIQKEWSGWDLELLGEMGLCKKEVTVGYTQDTFGANYVYSKLYFLGVILWAYRSMLYDLYSLT